MRLPRHPRIRRLPSAAEAPKGTVPTKAASSEAETVVENDLYKIVFTNRGAQVKHWILKKYKDEDGQPLDLVNKDAAKFGLPLSLYVFDENLRNQINSALYVASAGGTLSAPAELTYEYAQGDTTVRKSFQFGDSYVISVETEVTQNGKAVQAYPMWPAGFGDETNGPVYASARIEYMANDKVERLAAKKVSGGNTLRGPFSWAGAQDQFFAAIFLPDNPDTAAMVTLHDSISVPKDPKKPDPNNTVQYDVLGAAVGDANGRNARAAVRGSQGAGSPGIRALQHRSGADERSRPAQCGGLWLLQHHRPPAVPVAEVDARAHGQQLGRGHHHPDRHHQPGAAAAAHHQHEVGAEDAEAAAADEGHPGAVQEVADARSQASGDERRDRRALQARRA